MATYSSVCDKEVAIPEAFVRESHALVGMCLSVRTCRRVFILDHYGVGVVSERKGDVKKRKGKEKEPGTRRGAEFRCGHCDVCCEPYPKNSTIRATKALLDALMSAFRMLAKDTGPRGIGADRVTLNGLAKHTAREIDTSVFSPGDSQRRALSTIGGREQACRRVLQNLVLQGVFIEYAVQTRFYHIYIKVSMFISLFPLFMANTEKSRWADWRC